MRTTKLTETQKAVEAEMSFPTSCAKAKFSFEKGSDNCTAPCAYAAAETQRGLPEVDCCVLDYCTTILAALSIGK